MAQTFASVHVAGQAPSQPLNVRTVRLTFEAADTYTTGGLNISVAFAAAFPGETVMAAAVVADDDGGGNVRFFQVVPNAGTPLLLVYEVAAGPIMQELPNATNFSAHSTLDIFVVTH